MAAGDFIQGAFLFSTCRRVENSHHSVHPASCEYLLVCYVTFLQTDKRDQFPVQSSTHSNGNPSCHSSIRHNIHLLISSFRHLFIRMYIHTFRCSYVNTFMHQYVSTFIHQYVSTFIRQYVLTASLQSRLQQVTACNNVY